MILETVEQRLALAREHRRAGRVHEAEDVYDRILRADPQHSATRVARLTLLLQTNRREEGLTWLRAIVAATPPEQDAWLALGYGLHVDDALDEAAFVYRGARTLFPGDDEVLYRLGNVERARGNIDEAIACLRGALQLRPGHWEARNNLGLVLEKTGQSQEAAWQLREAIRVDASHAEAHFNLGISLTSLGDLEQAAAAYRAATSLDPGYAEAFVNLGAVSKATGELDEAAAAFETALRLRPDWAAAHSNLAGVREWQGRHDDAVAEHRRAISLEPTSPVFHGNLLFTLLFHPADDEDTIRREGAEWNRRHAEPIARPAPPHANDRSPERRLRIGYVCGLFRDHVLGRYLLPLLREHDRTSFEVICYSNNRSNDALTARFRDMASGWCDIAHLSDEDAASRIRSDAVDILIDTSLHMEGNRLLVFARKPAPVQVTLGGYPASTGLEAIDYRFSDIHLDPPGEHDARYPEKTWRLPHTFWCYDPAGASVAVNDGPAQARGSVTFGCLNNFAKVNAGVLALWARVLAAVPGSRLLLLAHEGRHRGEAKALLNATGVEHDRVEFVGYRSRQRYLELFKRIDISLDTFPYNGHTTSLDSLWMGVPVVTLVANNAVGRAGLSQANNLDLPDLVARNADQYVEIARVLAADIGSLQALRRGLRSRMEQSPLMDAAGFARDVEAAYRASWRTWCCNG